MKKLFEKIYHVLQADEWIINSYNFDTFLQSAAQHKATDSAKSDDSFYKKDVEDETDVVYLKINNPKRKKFQKVLHTELKTIFDHSCFWSTQI